MVSAQVHRIKVWSTINAEQGFGSKTTKQLTTQQVTCRKEGKLRVQPVGTAFRLTLALSQLLDGRGIFRRRACITSAFQSPVSSSLRWFMCDYVWWDQCAPWGWGEDFQHELLENIRICEVCGKGDNLFRLCQGEALKLFLSDSSVRKKAWAKSSILTLQRLWSSWQTMTLARKQKMWKLTDEDMTGRHLWFYLTKALCSLLLSF